MNPDCVCLNGKKNLFCRECREVDWAAQSDADNTGDIIVQKILFAESTHPSQMTDGVCTMFQGTEFTSPIHQDDCPRSPRPFADSSGFADRSECSMRSARFELAMLEAQTQSQLEV